MVVGVPEKSGERVGDSSFCRRGRSSGAAAVGPELARAGERGVGETVLGVVEASRRTAPANTNLGIALLLAPLAKAALDGAPLRTRLGATLRALDVADAHAAYAAIRVSGAGGLRERVEHDVRSEPTV